MARKLIILFQKPSEKLSGWSVVLGFWKKGKRPEFITWERKDIDDTLYSGHYYAELPAAYADFKKRR